MIFNQKEIKIICFLSLVLFFRMFSVFLVLPIFNILVQELEWSNFFLIGIAFGIYGLTQGVFQLPFGYFSDKYGRKKTLSIALVFFFLGSLLATQSTNIYLMIFARFIQGIGAIASIVFSLLADFTRDEVRARASAFLGISIGIAFCSAFILAPFLAIYFTINDFFLIISILALLSFLVVLFFIPKSTSPPSTVGFVTAWNICWKNTQLRIIYFGSFLSGVGLSSSLFISQIFFFNYFSFPKNDLWKIYLPMLIVSCLVLFPVTFYAEKNKKFKNSILIAMGFLLSSFIFFLWGTYVLHFGFIVLGLIVFFAGYSIFEPIFPSLVTRWSNSENKGIASGIYNFLQFFGHFVGAFLSGLLIKIQVSLIYMFLILMSIFFIYSLKYFHNPPSRKKME